MKVVCVKIEGYTHQKYYPITIGKVYNVEYESRSLYWIVCDDGTESTFWKRDFEPLHESRDKKLEKLGI